MALIKFTRNHQDKCTDNGFQFEFFCDRCGNGYESTFQGSATGMISQGLDTAANIFGGLFGAAAQIGDRAHSVAWQQQKDAAFAKAVEEVKPMFVQCHRCGKWVCKEVCWNKERGMCKDCAPDLEQEYSAAQTQAAIQQAQQVAQEGTYVTADKFKETIVGTCPNCGADLTGGKFCPECGKPVSQKKFCKECGKPVQAGVKFCPECGAQQ
ncbi:MAG: zinc ribbon domain-containing protein [Chloroflexi bacterium]|nr:zinc ribbon domain-containing protein [Chloroflexota bacterium]MCL5951832.1 zinc ribbon domain-containing protein [Chloroflexota bacterium]